MSVENPALVTWTVLIILALVFLQGIGLGLALFFLGRQISSVQGEAIRMVGFFSKLLDQTDRLLAGAESLQERLPEGMAKLSASLRWFNRRVKDLDQCSIPVLARLTGELERVNDRTDSLLSGFGSATYRIHRAVINPARHVSAALSAVQESVLYFFTRGRLADREYAHPEDENFI